MKPVNTFLYVWIGRWKHATHIRAIGAIRANMSLTSVSRFPNKLSYFLKQVAQEEGNGYK